MANYVAVLNLVSLATQVADEVSRTVGTKGKVEVGLKYAPGVLVAVEQVVGKDLVNDEAVKPFVDELVKAFVAVLEAIEKAKDVPAKKPVA